ncbi:MAG TPA: hypothetical protein VLA12_23070 [Planctomycetaceae bacterium]|nr:hypothetical protein [Planctomycetaceae bacterium]
MFRCQICGRVVAAKKRANKLVITSRSKTYASRGSNRETGFRRRFVPVGPKKDYDKGGQGSEIVQELTACDSCAETHAANVTLIPETPTHQEEHDTTDYETADYDNSEKD